MPGGRKIKNGECSYRASNAVRTLAMVRVWGLEPQRIAAREPKSRMSANSIIPADVLFTIPHSAPWYKRKLRRIWYYCLCKNWTYAHIQKVV